MRILGKSSADKTKYIVEVDEKELEKMKKINKEPIVVSQEASTFRATRKSIVPSNNNEITTDDILDAYNDKHISKEEMVEVFERLTNY